MTATAQPVANEAGRRSAPFFPNCTEAVTDVVAAVIFGPDGRFLLARRPEGKVYAGWWEFPGGKVEAGETSAEAVARELHEELGIDVELACPWITRYHRYEHATVRLQFHRVYRFHGEPKSREGQQLAWQRVGSRYVEPMLPANGPVLSALALPELYAISDATALGTDRFLERLRDKLDSGLRLVQIREPALGVALAPLARAAILAARSVGARVLVNADLSLMQDVGADGLHLKSTQLGGVPDVMAPLLLGASCHDRHDLECAVAMGADFAVLGPVLPTLSHPGAATLGWDGFESIARGSPIPVYAIGGLTGSDLGIARAHGSHGLAMQRAAWRD